MPKFTVDRLMDAIQTGDTAKLREVVESFGDSSEEKRKIVNEDRHFDTPLIKAINGCFGHGEMVIKEMVAILLSAGADPNKVSQRQQTPLVVAAEIGYKEIAEMLLHAGADVNQCSAVHTYHGFVYPCTPIATAIYTNHQEIAALFLHSGAEVNKTSACGYFVEFAHSNTTPLWLAANAGQKEMVEMLISAGANPNIADFYGYTPLDIVQSSIRERGYSNSTEAGKRFTEIAELLSRAVAGVKAAAPSTGSSSLPFFAPPKPSGGDDAPSASQARP